MKTLLVPEVSLKMLYKFLIFFILIGFISSCTKDSTNIDQNFLKGYWTYLNGAEAYYDGVSDSAIGTKVPTNNVGFDFVVGEKYWKNLRKISDTTWSLNHIVRTMNGMKSYNHTTFKRMKDNRILANISGYGTDTLTKRP
jgi:hypothetical protein